MKNIHLKAIFAGLYLTILYGCQPIEKNIELPLPEIFLTSTITDITQTKVQIKGERAGIRNNGTDVFGVVYSEKPTPTIEDAKLSVSQNNGVFDVTAQNLRANTVYYFRAYVQTENKVYYSNQLVSSGVYDNRWERLDDIPDTFKYFTGVLFHDINENLTVVNAEDETKSYVPIYIFSYNYRNGIPNKKTWFEAAGIDFLRGVKEMMIMNPSLDRTMVGGGFTINSNLPSPRVYSKRILFFATPISEFTVSLPTEGEIIGMTIGTQMFIVETRNAGIIWEFTNLEAARKRSHTFQNLGRAIATGIQDKGYVMVESANPTIRGGVFYEYNPVSDSWMTKRPFAGEDRREGTIFSCKGKVYYGLGKGRKSGQILKDIWEYNPDTDNWQQVAFYPGNGNINLIKTERNGIVYLGMGYQTTLNNIEGTEFSGVRDFWTFKP